MADHDDRYTLITNVSYVRHADVRLNVRAIVIASDIGRSVPRQQVRMFGPSPSWPVCDVDVPIVPYELTEPPQPSWMPAGARLVCREYDLRFVKPDNERESLAEAVLKTEAFHITTNMQDSSPLVVRDFPEGASISQVWDELIPAVRQSWEAPYFPTLVHGPR